MDHNPVQDLFEKLKFTSAEVNGNERTLSCGYASTSAHVRANFTNTHEEVEKKISMYSKVCQNRDVCLMNRQKCRPQTAFTCVYIKHISIHMDMYIYTCRYVCMYVCVCVCIDACIYACM